MRYVTTRVSAKKKRKETIDLFGYHEMISYEFASSKYYFFFSRIETETISRVSR